MKVHHTTLSKDDFLEPKKLPSGKDFVIASFDDEYPDVNIQVRVGILHFDSGIFSLQKNIICNLVFAKVKIYQKISQGIHVPAGKFGIMLESEHYPKVSLSSYEHYPKVELSSFEYYPKV